MGTAKINVGAKLLVVGNQSNIAKAKRHLSRHEKPKELE
jgi:hypothetical protein